MHRNRVLPAIAATIVAAWLAAMAWAAIPCLAWPDRRPVGALFLASNHHVSARNPRGWFNSPELDVTGPGGHARFCQELLRYADRSVEVLRSTNSQGMIVWDVEGEQFPHKTTYIGDPGLAEQLAPETAGCLDQFFARFTRAGLRVGMTIRPQQLELTPDGTPRQTSVWNYAKLLGEKIDYAQRRWGATLFYIDSNGGVRWPFEAFHLRRVAAARPGILLIPEYQHPLYYSFSAPYDDLRRGDGGTPGLIRRVFPLAFKVLNTSDSIQTKKDIASKASKGGDILLFPAWFCGPECEWLRAVAR